VVVGGGTEPAVADDGTRRPAGNLNDPLDCRDQLGCIRRIALLQLVVGDEPTLVLGHQQGVAELGRMLGLPLLPLRIGRASGSLKLTSRSAITRLPASRWSVCHSNRSVSPIDSWSSSTRRRSRRSPGRRASALRALRSTAWTCRTVCLAIPATWPVSRSTSAIATPVRWRSVRATCFIRRPSRPTTVPKPGPAGRALGLDAPHQPAEFADRLLQQVRVSGIVDVCLDHDGVHPQLAPAQQPITGQLVQQRAVELRDRLRAGAAYQLDQGGRVRHRRLQPRFGRTAASRSNR
jgi:hypothetical protein